MENFDDFEIITNEIEKIANNIKNNHVNIILSDFYKKAGLYPSLPQSTNFINHQQLSINHDQHVNIKQINQQIDTFVEKSIGRIDVILRRVIENHLKPSQIKHIMSKVILDVIQNWFEQIFDCLWELIGQLSTIGSFNHLYLRQNDQKFKDDCEYLLKYLLTHSLVFDEQPNLVMKTNSKYSATVRFLVGRKIHTLESNTVKTVLQLISSEDAQKILRNERIPDKLNTGDIINNEKFLSLDQHRKTFQSQFS